MRSPSSSIDNKARSCPISWTSFSWDGRRHRWLASPAPSLSACVFAIAENSRTAFPCHTPLPPGPRATKPPPQFPSTLKDHMSSIPATMTAIGISAPGGPEMLVPVDRPVPQPGEGEILDQGRGRRRQPARRACSARAFIRRRRGARHPGARNRRTVVACGAGATRWKMGDAGHRAGDRRRLCANIASPTKPHALPLPRASAWSRPPRFRKRSSRLAQRLRARRAEGRGDAAGPWRQLRHRHHRDPARQGVRGARHHHRRKRREMRGCRRLGADVAVNYKTEDFVAATKAATGGTGAQLILDMVGGDYIERNYDAAAVEGRIVQIAFQGFAPRNRRFPPPAVQAASSYRLGAARACGCGQGRDRDCARTQCLAVVRGRQGPPGDGQHLPAGGSCARPMPAWKRASISARLRSSSRGARYRRHAR